MNIYNLEYEKIILILILIVLASMILTGCTMYIANLTERCLDKYIEKNHTSFNFKDDDYIKDFSIKDKDIKKHDIFWQESYMV